MENLRVTLTELELLLDQMETLLTEEIKQLSLIRVNPVALQSISDNKSRLLSSIDFYDKQRQQIEANGDMVAPYKNSPELSSLWESVVAKTKNANELNHRSFVLLEVHMQKMDQLKKLFKDVGGNNTIYASSGKAEDNSPGQMYNISI